MPSNTLAARLSACSRHAHFHFEDRADRLGLTAVDDELQATLDERVLLALDHRFETQQPLLARDVAPLDDFLDQGLGFHRRRLEYPAHVAHRVFEHGQRRLDEDGRDRAHDDDHERRGRQQCGNARALEHGAHEHRDQREYETDRCENVHDSPDYLPAAIADSNASMSSWPDTASRLSSPPPAGRGRVPRRARSPATARGS
jgi:hypothetical protein